jgi:branched-subunit amino acid aminotransferase/4-amino-4-deoxychorismate lyase
MKNRTLLFGEGLFETFRVYEDRKLVFVDDHLDRMAAGCAFFILPFSREEALASLEGALREIPRNSEARLRLNLVCYGDHRVEKTDFQSNWEPLERTGFDPNQGVKMGLAPFQRFSRSPLVRHKTTSYLENVFVYRFARSRGLFDALFTNERNQVTEGSITNVFFVREGEIRTPPLDAGLLPGITRKHVLEATAALGLPVSESPVLSSELDQFDSIFVTNSVIEIRPVNLLAGRVYEIPEFIGAIWKIYRERAFTSAFTCTES